MIRIWKHRFGMEEDFFTRSRLHTFNVKTLRSLAKEMKSEVQRISQHLVHILVEKDKISRMKEERTDHVTDILVKYAESNGLDADVRFYLNYTSYFNDMEYQKWVRSWSLVSQIHKGIIKQWRKRVWEGVAMFSTRQISWERVLPHLVQEKPFTNREREWKRGIEQSLQQLSSFSADPGTVERVLVSYSRLFPLSVFCPEFTTLAVIAIGMTGDEELTLKILVTLLEDKFPPQYFAEGLHSVKTDMCVLSDLIRHFLPQLSAHMQLLRSFSSANILKSYSSHSLPSAKDCSSFEPPLVDSLSFQWMLSCFTSCLPWKSVKRVFDSLIIEDSEILVFTALAIWTLMESELLKVTCVPDFYVKAAEIREQLKSGKLVSSSDFIQIVYTLKQCASDKHDGISVSELRKAHSTGASKKRSSPFCPPPSQGGSFIMPPMPESALPNSFRDRNHSPTTITALAECPQIKRSGFVFSYAYAADVPLDLPVKYAIKMSRNCTQLLKDGTVFSMGGYDTDTTELFKDPS